MRKALSFIFLIVISAGLALAQTHTRARAFTGQIMDSACAATGSHAAGYKMTGTHTPRACTLACVKAGSKFVLYNSAHKTIYKLDNQKKPRAFAGENVRITGTYDAATKTIHVERIARVR